MIPALPASVGFRQTVSASKRVKFAPPSVDFQSPYGGRPGARVTTPPLETELTPRTPRVEPTYGVLPSTTIDEMERPLNAGPGVCRRRPLAECSRSGAKHGIAIDLPRGDARIRGEVRPCAAAVSRLVDAEASLRIGRCIRLAGSRVKRRGRGIIGQRPHRVRCEATG